MTMRSKESMRGFVVGRLSCRRRAGWSHDGDCKTDALQDSNTDDEAGRILDRLLHLYEEGDGLFAVDEAVVVAQREIHHRADDDLAVDGDRTIVDRVHAEDGALRRVDDRRREERAEGAAVGDGEDATFEVGERDLAFAGALGGVGDFRFDG